MAAKKRAMGGKLTFGGATAGDALDDAVGARATESRRTEAPAEAPPPERERLTVTTYRVTEAQAMALSEAALERKRRLGGKADASAVLREILDAWMRERGR